MSFHMLAVTRDSAWRTTPEAFSAALRQAWPDAEVRALHDRSLHCLAWRLVREDREPPPGWLDGH